MSDGEFQIPEPEMQSGFEQVGIDTKRKGTYNILLLVKDNFVYFNFFRQGHFYYNLMTKTGTYQFPIPLEDIGTATLQQREKAVTFMKWVRRAIEDKTFIRL